MSHQETDTIHPRVAEWLDLQCVEWWHEVMIGTGQHRVDFLARGNGTTLLIECKRELSPKADIKQIKSYHARYGDPRAIMMVAAPYEYKPQSYLKQYTDEGVKVLQIEGDFPTRSMFHDIPDRSGLFACLTQDEIAQVRDMYSRYHLTAKQLAFVFNAPVAVVTQVLYEGKVRQRIAARWANQ